MSQFRATSFFDVKQTLWECRPCCEKRLTCWWRNSILLGFANDGPTSVSALLCPVKRLCLWHLKKKLKALPLDKEIRTIFFEDIKELVIVGDHMIFFYVFNSPTITTKSPLTVTWAASWMCGWIFFFALIPLVFGRQAHSRLIGGCLFWVLKEALEGIITCRTNLCQQHPGK